MRQPSSRPLPTSRFPAGTAIIDLLTSAHAFGGILLALLHLERTGDGQLIECSLLATQIGALANLASNYLNANVVARASGTAHPSICPYQAFKTRDGRFYVVGAGDNAAFAALCAHLGLDDLAVQPDFASNALRVKNRDRLIAILSAK